MLLKSYVVFTSLSKVFDTFEIQIFLIYICAITLFIDIYRRRILHNYFTTINKMGTTASKKDLTEEDISMLVANTDFSREKILEWFDEFKAECKDGLLDKKAFIKFYKELLPNTGTSDEFASYVFKGNTIKKQEYC